MSVIQIGDLNARHPHLQASDADVRCIREIQPQSVCMHGAVKSLVFAPSIQLQVKLLGQFTHADRFRVDALSQIFRVEVRG